MFEENFYALGGGDCAGGAKKNFIWLAAANVGQETGFGLTNAEEALVANETAFDITALDRRYL